MAYDGEVASYLPLQRVADSEQVRNLLRRSKRVSPSTAGDFPATPSRLPESGRPLPPFVLAIDGSNTEVNVSNGYPGARVGYITVASVLLKLALIDELDEDRPVDPVKFRTTEEAATSPAALPGSNVVTRDYMSARDSFRAELYELFHDAVVDDGETSSILETYEALLACKPREKQQTCPFSYDDCDQGLFVPAGLTECPCSRRRAIFSTDALRIHEGFKDDAPNGELLGEVMQVWERVLLVHLLRSFEQNGWLDKANQFVFFVDGPLAVFGHPAWLSAAISRELKRINAEVERLTGNSLLIVGIEKSGAFVEHFHEIDGVRVDTDSTLFAGRTFMLPSDEYIKRRIIYSTGEKRYGAATYFGRKFFYKTRSGSRIVASLPFLNDAQDTLDEADVDLYPQISQIGDVLDKLVSSRAENAVTPILSAHSHAAIPLHLGEKVLKQLAAALMKDGR